MKFLITILVLGSVVISVWVLNTTRTVATVVNAEVNGRAYGPTEKSEPIAPGPSPVVRSVSAYTLGRIEETDDSPCIGAFGDNLCDLVSQGVSVCASNAHPKRTRLMVGNIECIVLDRMNKRYVNGEVDIAMLEYWRARMFGRQNLPVTQLP